MTNRHCLRDEEDKVEQGVGRLVCNENFAGLREATPRPYMIAVLFSKGACKIATCLEPLSQDKARSYA